MCSIFIYLFIYEDIGVLGIEKKAVVHDRYLKAEMWRTAGRFEII